MDYIVTPQIFNFTYILGSGKIELVEDRLKFYQTPNCRYSFNVSSYYTDGAEFNVSMVNFTDD